MPRRASDAVACFRKPDGRQPIRFIAATFLNPRRQNQSTALGANAVLEAADNAADQLWQLVPNGTGASWLANAGSGLQWIDNGTPDHLWTITPS